MNEDLKIPYPLEIPFKGFSPGQFIKSEQFNDDFDEIELKVNEIINKFNLTTGHIYDKNNPHEVTAQQVGAYSVVEIDELLDDIRSGNLFKNSIGNELLKDESVDSRVLKNNSVNIGHIDDSVGNQIDISKNTSISIIYDKMNEKLADVQAGVIIDSSIGIDKLKKDVGEKLDISINPSILNVYSKKEVEKLLDNRGMIANWGDLTDTITPGGVIGGGSFPYKEISSIIGSIGGSGGDTPVEPTSSTINEAKINTARVVSQTLTQSMRNMSGISVFALNSTDVKHTWVSGDLITDVRMNSIENRIEDNQTRLDTYDEQINKLNDTINKNKQVVVTLNEIINQLTRTVNTMKTKLDGIEDGANKYIHPITHPANIIVEDSIHRFVTDEQISKWNSNSSSSGGSSGDIEVVDFSVPCEGVDVSKWQGDMNWNAIKTAGSAKFAILRIGAGGRSGNSPSMDSKFTTYLNACIENKIPVGVYFFSYADSLDAVKKEANWVVEQLNKYPKTFEFPIFFDQEDASLNTVYDSSTGKYTSYNPGKATLTNYMNTFCKIISDAGYMAGIYTNANWSTYYINWNDLQYKEHMWIAQWSSTLTWSKSEVKIWQRAVSQITGHTGDIDVDVCYFDYPNHVRQNHLHGF